MDKPRYLNSIRVHAVVSATAAGLATDVESWLAANAGLRTFVQIDYETDHSTEYVAFITYTE